MKFWLRIIIPVLALAAAGCHGSAPETDSAVLKTVPSRAIAVAHFSRADKALALFTDSTSVFRRLDLGGLHDSEACLSWVYSADLVPVLAIDAGRSGSDTTSVAAKVIARAEELGLHCCHSGAALKRTILIFSPLQAVVDEAQAHIDAQTSIMDAPGFAEACKLAEGGAGTLYLRGSAARRWLPRGIFRGIFPRVITAGMISSYSDWFVANFDSYSAEKVAVRYLKDEAGGHYARVIESIPGGDVKVASVLPEDYALLVDFPVGNAKKYMEAWTSYLDVNALLPANRVKAKNIGASHGITPQAWAAKLNIREIAFVARFNRADENVPAEARIASRVLRVRANKKSGLPKGPGAFECPGAPGVLFGGLFRLEDESFCAPLGRWMVIGSEQDVRSYIEDAGRVKLPALPGSKCKFAVCTPDWQIAATGEEIGLKIWN